MNKFSRFFLGLDLTGSYAGGSAYVLAILAGRGQGSICRCTIDDHDSGIAILANSPTYFENVTVQLPGP